MIRSAQPLQNCCAPLLLAPVTTVLALVSVLVYVIPGAATVFEMDWVAVAAGQFWRVITGHLTHWSGNHLAWDLGVFVVLAWLCESRSRRVAYLTLAVAALLVPASLLFHAGLDSYRGLSGLDTALFALLGVWFLRDGLKARDWPSVTVCFVLLSGMAGKIGWEAITGRCLFVDAAASGFAPVPYAHLIGAVVGMVAGWLPGRQPRP